jgi:hypothetical protein
MKTVTMLKVLNSSSVAGVGYLSECESLFIKFGSGALYKYADVPEVVYTDVVKLVVLGNMGTKSPAGKFVQDHIKGVYQFEKIIQPSAEYAFVNEEGE